VPVIGYKADLLESGGVKLSCHSTRGTEEAVVTTFEDAVWWLDAPEQAVIAKVIAKSRARTSLSRRIAFIEDDYRPAIWAAQMQ